MDWWRPENAESCVLATVVHGFVTAAKPGPSDDIRPTADRGRMDRRQLCARRRAQGGARGARDGQPRMVSVQPEDLLAELSRAREPRRRPFAKRCRARLRGPLSNRCRRILSGHARRQSVALSLAEQAGRLASTPRRPAICRGSPHRHADRQLPSAHLNRARRAVVVQTQARRRAAWRHGGTGAAYPPSVEAGKMAAPKLSAKDRRRRARPIRPRPASAPSRRKRSRCHLWPRSPSQAGTARRGGGGAGSKTKITTSFSAAQLRTEE